MAATYSTSWDPDRTIKKTSKNPKKTQHTFKTPFFLSDPVMLHD
jgi:hypothetical protein